MTGSPPDFAGSEARKPPDFAGSEGGRPPNSAGPMSQAPWGVRGAVVLPVLAYGGQVLLVVLLASFARLTLLLLNPNLENEPEVLERLILQSSLLPVALASALLTLGLVYASVSILSGRPFLAALGLRRPSAASLGFAASGVAVAFGSLLAMALFPPDEELPLGPMSELARSGPFGHLVWALLAVAVAPVVEEILFRGYAYLGARERLGAVRAGTAVTLLFVGLHLTETGGWWPATLGIAAISVLLAAIMQRTGNLTHCIACHAGYNATHAALSFLGPA